MALEPEVIVMKLGSLFTAFHPQALDVITLTLPVPPAAKKFCELPDSEKLQSSLMIEPVPSASLIVAPLAPDKCTVKASSASEIVSPVTSTVIVLVLSAGRKLSVPETG